MGAVEERDRESLIQEVFSRLFIELEVEQGSYGSSPKLRVKLKDGDKLLASDYVSLSSLRSD